MVVSSKFTKILLHIFFSKNSLHFLILLIYYACTKPGLIMTSEKMAMLFLKHTEIPLPGLNFFWKKGRFCSAILCISTSFVEDFKCVPLKVVSSQGINFMCKIFDNKNWSVLMTKLLINLCTNLAQCKSS